MRKRAGDRLAPSVAIENGLYDSVRPLVSAMFKAADGALKRGGMMRVRRDSKHVFRKGARAATADFVNKVVQYTRSRFKAAVKGFNATPEDALRSAESVKRVEKVWRSCENLLASLPEVFFSKLDAAIISYNNGDMTEYAFERRYESLKEQTYTRLRLIAKGQNNAATEALMVSRCKECGVYLVKWCHSHLSAVPRDYHLRKWDGHTGKRNGKPNGLNGYIFPIDKPPVIDRKTGERGYPAQLINCKCYLVPVEEYP